MVGSWGRSEVGSAPSSILVKRWGKTCGWKMGQPGLKTGTPSSDQGLVGRWGRPVLRLGRSEDGHNIYTMVTLSECVKCFFIIWKCDYSGKKNFISWYRLGMVNSNMINSKFHLIESFFEIFARFLSFHV